MICCTIYPHHFDEISEALAKHKGIKELQISSIPSFTPEFMNGIGKTLKMTEIKSLIMDGISGVII